MLNRDEAILVIDYYNSYASSGFIDRSKNNTDKKLVAIALEIINKRKGYEWYEYILRLEEKKKIQAKINKYDDTWINSPYYKFKSPTKPLPADYKQRIEELQSNLNKLNSLLEKPAQDVGRVSRKRVQKQKLYA